MSQERNKALQETITRIKDAMAGGTTVATITTARGHLENLAKRAELFPRDEFPMPPDGEPETVFCLYSEPDGRNTIYLSVANKGMTYRPHNHGNSWAMVAGIEGLEKHYLYERADQSGDQGKADLVLKGELTIAPGTGVSLLPEGIHSIEAVGEGPLLALHCYEFGFPHQDGRVEFDLASGTCETVYNEDAVIDRNIYGQSAR